MEAVINEPIIDPLTLAFDSGVKETFALGQGEHSKKIFRWLCTDLVADPFSKSLGSREVFKGPNIDEMATQITYRVVYAHNGRGYWELETEVGRSDYDDILYDPIIELCQRLRNIRLNSITRNGVSNG